MKQIRLWLTALALFLLDQGSKALLAEADFLLLPGILRLRGTRNTGMAFGWLGGQRVLLIALTAALLLGSCLYIKKHPLPRRLQYALGALLGGAVGNLCDRVRLGYVIDFIEPVFARLFIFNVADIGITCGAAALLMYVLTQKEEKHE